jgi:hypothetical protein
MRIFVVPNPARVAAMTPDAIAGGIVASIIWALGIFLWRRYWNPVRWKYEKLYEDLWQLTRVSGRRAKLPVLMRESTAGPQWREWTGDLPNANHEITAAGMRRNDWRQTIDSPLDRAFYLTWLEGNKRLRADFDLRPHTVEILIRRREIRRNPLLPPWEEPLP